MQGESLPCQGVRGTASPGKRFSQRFLRTICLRKLLYIYVPCHRKPLLLRHQAYFPKIVCLVAVREQNRFPEFLHSALDTLFPFKLHKRFKECALWYFQLPSKRFMIKYLAIVLSYMVYYIVFYAFAFQLLFF